MQTETDYAALDDLMPSESNRYVRQLQLNMRGSHPGRTLEDAIEDLVDLGIDRPLLDEAAELIRRKAEDIQRAQVPRAVIAGTIESWYFGPQRSDANWPRLVSLLSGDGWSDDQLKALDDASTKIVAQLPNPVGPSRRRAHGLVLGYVQSGKTTNFTAVIAKAADAGYKLIIVLSGMHDALRNQTQDRLNDQLWALSTDRWHRLTNESDFRPDANVDALLRGSGQWVIAVVKKNGARLRALRTWLNGARTELRDTCPILVIDDEADQASVNTAKPDRQPQTINRLIRAIVNESPRGAYVGYTATPFANVLIDPSDASDLYPKDFIVDLDRPREYIGAEALFGREPLEHDDETVDDGHDVIRAIPDDEIGQLRPTGAASRHQFSAVITDSLDDALRYFLLSSAARRARGTGNPHHTALIHTSQHVSVHMQTAEAVEDHIRGLAARLQADDAVLYREMEEHWDRETARVPASDFDLEPVPWAQVVEKLAEVATDTNVIMDNSVSLERLAFRRNEPRTIIAVGGNTLSRGLTLEGLAVSYFVRSSSAYDTLLQMGRWFGYRNGYADLTRIWLTDEMRDWFRHLATVEQEIRYDIARYEIEGETPATLGVRIRTHPKMAVTAAAKMQTARSAQVSYSGRRLQTIQFRHRDLPWLEENRRAACELVSSVGGGADTTGRPGVTLIRSVDSAAVLDFLQHYRFHENSFELNGDAIRRYILGRRSDGELESFTVALMGKAPEDAKLGVLDFGTGPVGCISRSRLNNTADSTSANIKALMSPVDRAIDLGVPLEQLRKMEADPVARLRNPRTSGGLGDGSGLLLLYPISKDSRPREPSEDVGARRSGGPDPVRVALESVAHIVGVGLVFPVTDVGHAAVDYVTANVLPFAGVEVEILDEEDLQDQEPA